MGGSGRGETGGGGEKEQWKGEREGGGREGGTERGAKGERKKEEEGRQGTMVGRQQSENKK